MHKQGISIFNIAKIVPTAEKYLLLFSDLFLNFSIYFVVCSFGIRFDGCLIFRTANIFEANELCLPCGIKYSILMLCIIPRGELFIKYFCHSISISLNSILFNASLILSVEKSTFLLRRHSSNLEFIRKLKIKNH